MFAIVAVPFESFQDLPPFEFKLMAAVLRYVNRQGECCPALHQLAADVLSSEATVSRAMARLEERGCFTRERQGNGRYLYRIAERFLTCRAKRRFPVSRNREKARQPIVGQPTSVRHLAAVQDGLSHGARQEVDPSSDQRSSEGEQAALSEGEIPNGWEAAAAAERRLAGLPDVDYQVEWRKLVAYSEGQRITIWRWRGWVLKARCECPALAGPRAMSSTETVDNTLPGDERQQRQARDWVRTGFWLRSGMWGPVPDQPGCTLPAALIAWCLAERAAAA